MSEERNIVVGFKVNQREHDQMKRVAKICFDREKLPNDTVGALARALTFVKINEWLAIEQLQRELDEREKSRNSRLGVPCLSVGPIKSSGCCLLNFFSLQAK